MNFEHLLLREEGSTLIVTIHRPEALNALNRKVMESFMALQGWLEKSQNAHLKAVILTGSGEKAFVAGADIKEFESMTPDAAAEFALSGQKVMSGFEVLRLPVIAAVNGFALGGGLELALACDFIYAAENAKFALPECTLGIMPGFGGTVRLPRRVGPALAREMAFSGAMISAAEGLRIGLVNRVVSNAELLKVALETAQLIGSRAPLAIAGIKRSIHEGMDVKAQDAGDIEAAYFSELFSSQDKNEGVRAFVEKRKAQFSGK